jgi:hypothetical protein
MPRSSFARLDIGECRQKPDAANTGGVREPEHWFLVALLGECGQLQDEPPGTVRLV